MLLVDPSEQCPVAVNCCVEPVVKRVGGFGAIAIEDNVGAETAVDVEVNVVVVATGTVVEDDFDEQDTVTKTNTATNHIARQ